MMDTNQFQPLETLLRKLMAQADDGVALWDISNQQFIYVNESLEKLIGVSRMALYHSPESFWEAIHAEDFPSWQPLSQLRSEINTEQLNTTVQAYRIARPDGSVRWVQERCYPITNEADQCLAWGLVLQDLTAIKKWQGCLEQDYTRQENTVHFYHQFCHQSHQLLQQHFQTMQQWINQFSLVSMPMQERREVNQLFAQLQQMLTLSDDMLRCIQDTGSNQQLETTQSVSFNLYDAIESLQDVFSLIFATKQQRFIVNVDSKLRRSFLGNVVQLKHALRCLVLLLFTQQEESPQVIFLQAQEMGKTNNSMRCKFSVSSMKQQKTEQAYPPVSADQFVELGTAQLPQATQKIKGETASVEGPFRLAAERALKMLEAELKVDQLESGEQYTTEVEFVYANTETSMQEQDKQMRVSPTPLQTPKAEPSQTESRFKALIIEDNLINQHVVSLILKELGCTVDVASNAQEALVLWANQYDLVFLDIGLPGMDGFELAYQLRERLANRFVPIIGMSAHLCVVEDDRDALGPLDDFINKPFGLDNVNALVSKWLKREREAEAVE